jgi:uncharacterized protein (TIGR00269 family)
MKCSKCAEKAVYHRRYEGTYYCKNHFIYMFEKRFLKEIRKSKMLHRKDIVAVGLSGGKDSSSLLYLFNKFAKMFGIEVVAIGIDEGLKKYRPKTLKAASKLCKSIGVGYHIVSFKSGIGVSLDDLPKKLKKRKINWCSWCGVWRRWLLNKSAKKFGATKLAVGHNLDDEAQSILMNFMRGDWRHLQYKPDDKNDCVDAGFIRRIKPLGWAPEKETTLYATLLRLPFCSAECPRSFGMLRRKVGRLLNEIELAHPGTKQQVICTADRIKASSKTGIKAASVCKQCGEVSANKICRACEMRQIVGK